MSDVKQVIVIRKDLKMRKGKMAAQAAHASMKVFLDRMEYCDHGDMKINDITSEMEEWINGMFTKIVVGIDSEIAMLDIYVAATMKKIPCALVKDAGLTEFNGEETNTCIALGPAKAEDIDYFTSDLKLL